jgi:hypothetical protein
MRVNPRHVVGLNVGGGGDCRGLVIVFCRAKVV